MKFSQLKKSGHWPTLLTSFLYFDVSFMVWTILGALGAMIAPSLGLDAGEKFLMVSTPILSGAFLRIVLSLLVDRIGTKVTGILAQLVVMAGLAIAWQTGLHSLQHALLLGLVLGLAGASFAVALPQSGRWYPPHLQGVVLGLDYFNAHYAFDPALKSGVAPAPNQYVEVAQTVHVVNAGVTLEW